MKTWRCSRSSLAIFRNAAVAVLAVVILGVATSSTAGRDHGWGALCHKHLGHGERPPAHIDAAAGGYWMWVRSPEQEKVVVMSLYNRYCIRCHGVDGRGVWDIPGVPDFTNVRWQACRTDDQIARIVIEGRGAVMPQFRGTLSIEEAWGMAHYLRTFVPGTEVSKPDLGASASPATPAPSMSNAPPNPAPAPPFARTIIPPPVSRLPATSASR